MEKNKKELKAKVKKLLEFSKKKKYIKLIQKYYKTYYKELKKVKCRTFREHVVKWTILLWGFSKTLWKLTVGTIRYGVLYRIQS